MLEVSSSNNGEDREGEFLLEDINFDDLFVGFDDGNILPDLDIDPNDIFADFSFESGEESGNTAAAVPDQDQEKTSCENDNKSTAGQGEVEVVSERTKEEKSASSDGGKGRKSSSAVTGKSSHGKKKAKVDWTPELHRRFVQAVEQLGVDKAVPSRILELMGIDCLTRHNIASHLQKYRSHRKHLLAREAEAAGWSHRRQMYTGGHGGGTKMNMNPNWVAPPIISFPLPMHQPPFRPLHVWGHPKVEHPQLVPVWPQPPWAPPRPPHAPPPPDPSYWYHPHYHRPLTQGTPCFPPPLMPATMQRYPAPPVPGIPPHHMFRPPPHSVAAPPTEHSGLLVQQLDAQQSNDSIDAAIGDVLAKPWLPLPLGLKPPSLESVMVELQKQGVAKVPPACGRT